jgi:hypothetical protein
MAEGFNPLRRALEVKMHAVVNDAARDIADRVNKVEPQFRAKPEQTGSGPQAAEVTVTGAAELPKDKKAKIIQGIEAAIEDTLKR